VYVLPYVVWSVAGAFFPTIVIFVNVFFSTYGSSSATLSAREWCLQPPRYWPGLDLGWFLFWGIGTIQGYVIGFTTV
jgi:hypothetical protein